MPIEEKVYMMHKLDFIFGTQKMLINVYFFVYCAFTSFFFNDAFILHFCNLRKPIVSSENVLNISEVPSFDSLLWSQILSSDNFLMTQAQYFSVMYFLCPRFPQFIIK